MRGGHRDERTRRSSRRQPADRRGADRGQHRRHPQDAAPGLNREDIDTRTTVIVRHLNLLLAQELGADGDPDIRDQLRQGYRLLGMTSRRTKQTAAFNTFFHTRVVANVARRALWIYTEPSHHAP